LFNARASIRRAAASALLATVAVASLMLASSAEAKQATLTAPAIADRDCTSDLRSGAATDTHRVTAPYLAALRVRLSAGSGDWDVAAFDARSERVIAGSASRGASEVAGGFVRAGERLVVQACRRSGSDSTAQVSVAFERIERGATEPMQLVKVLTPDQASEARLQSLGLDLTEHGGDGYVSVVLHGAADAAALRAAGLRFEVQVADLAAQSARQRAADRRFARRVESSRLPSGNTTYRRLFDYSEEMKSLVEQNPDLVRPLTLPHQTWEGRPVEGIEITTNPNQIRDGKPVFLQMGLHHAREWPSGEHSMEWAYELINGYRGGDPRATRLVESTRTIVVPVVNPDGFNVSREAGEALGHGDGDPEYDTIVAFVASPNEYRRKNCRTDGGACLTSVGLAEPGVDPNRNYGGFWGGPGASTTPVDQDYRGPGPFSEPETQNIRELVSERQVVSLITNHTFSNLVLRPPGTATQGDSVDEPLYKAFGDAMAAENGYLSQHGYELYDTTGTTEDWSYYATGGLGFTFEIGCYPYDPEEPNQNCIGAFHPPFADMVAEYEGTSEPAQAVGGGGNREAYFVAQERTAEANEHSLLTGQAPPGAVLRIEKSFQTPTSPQPDEDGDPILLDDRLSSELVVPDSGGYEWHINPSTRPLVAQERGRPALGEPSDSVSFSGTPASTAPCADYDTDDPSCWNDHPFEIPGGDGVDNDAATVAIEWATPASDWDMKVYRDVDHDGTSEAEEEVDLVGESGQGTTNEESTTFLEPETADGRLEPGDYVVRVINWAAAEPYEGEVSFAGPEEFVPASSESWTLTCAIGGEIRSSQEVTIDRGEQQQVDLRDACLRGAGGDTGGAGGTELRCAGRTATINGTKAADKLRGTKGNDVIALQGGRDKVNGRGGKDRICGGGGKDRIKGGGGKDRIKGQKGKDTLRGGGGKDRLGGGKGRDRIVGGAGKDRCKGGPGKDRLRSC
jgi:hypothetical protein